MTTASPSALRLTFFDYIFGEQEGIFCLATSHFLRGQFKQAFYEWPSQRTEVGKFVESKAKDHNIWFGVNLLRAAERVKVNCLPSGIVWADLDYVDPAEVNPPPTCVIESSPSRYQGFWRLEKIIPADVAEDFSKRVAYSTGADKSGWPLTKLLRVPHTLNFKYENPPEIRVVKAFETKVPIAVFEELPEVLDETEKGEWELVTQGKDTPDLTKLPKVENVIYRYRAELEKEIDAFTRLASTEPPEDADWSTLLWRLINICVEAGMEREEVFAIALVAECNKYRRDNRPVSHLWRDVCKAWIGHEKAEVVRGYKFAVLEMPRLVDEDKFEEDSFVKDYKKWGDAVTDAPMQYHELACFIALSALTSSGLKLDTVYGEVVPNIWGLVLGESTLTRKTTAMRMAMDIVTDIDESIILATDGSPEGLLTGLSSRPRRVSLFLKDEVSGFFDSLNKKDYLAGMRETLTQLYDVPKVLRRLLKKDTITISEPYFIFFGGGIRDRVYSLVNDDYITSGFLPRFLVVSGENDMDRFRPIGPPTPDTWDLKQKVITGMGELKVAYNVTAPVEVAGQHMLMPARIEAKLTDKAWAFFESVERKLVEGARDSTYAMTALPTFQRMAISILKMSVLIAVTRREPKDNNTIIVEVDDIQQAAWYVQNWGRYSVELLLNAGRPDVEKELDKVLAHVKDHPGCMKSEIMVRYRISAREMKDLIETLYERGLINIAKKGRATRLYPVG